MDRFYQLLFARLCEGVYKHYSYCLTHGAIFKRPQVVPGNPIPRYDHDAAACNTFELWPYDTPEKAYYLCKVLEKEE